MVNKPNNPSTTRPCCPNCGTNAGVIPITIETEEQAREFISELTYEGVCNFNDAIFAALPRSERKKMKKYVFGEMAKEMGISVKEVKRRMKNERKTLRSPK